MDIHLDEVQLDSLVRNCRGLKLFFATDKKLKAAIESAISQAEDLNELDSILRDMAFSEPPKINTNGSREEAFRIATEKLHVKLEDFARQARSTPESASSTPDFDPRSIPGYETSYPSPTKNVTDTQRLPTKEPQDGLADRISRWTSESISNFGEGIRSRRKALSEWGTRLGEQTSKKLSSAKESAYQRIREQFSTEVDPHYTIQDVTGLEAAELTIADLLRTPLVRRFRNPEDKQRALDTLAHGLTSALVLANLKRGKIKASDLLERNYILFGTEVISDSIARYDAAIDTTDPDPMDDILINPAEIFPTFLKRTLGEYFEGDYISIVKTADATVRSLKKSRRKNLKKEEPSALSKKYSKLKQRSVEAWANRPHPAKAISEGASSLYQRASKGLENAAQRRQERKQKSSEAWAKTKHKMGEAWANRPHPAKAVSESTTALYTKTSEKVSKGRRRVLESWANRPHPIESLKSTYKHYQEHPEEYKLNLTRGEKAGLAALGLVFLASIGAPFAARRIGRPELEQMILTAGAESKVGAQIIPTKVPTPTSGLAPVAVPTTEPYTPTPSATSTAVPTATPTATPVPPESEDLDTKVTTPPEVLESTSIDYTPQQVREIISPETMKDVVLYTTKSGRQVKANPDSLNDLARVLQEKLGLQDIPAETILESIAQANGLEYDKKSGAKLWMLLKTVRETGEIGNFVSQKVEVSLEVPEVPYDTTRVKQLVSPEGMQRQTLWDGVKPKDNSLIDMIELLYKEKVIPPWVPEEKVSDDLTRVAGTQDPNKLRSFIRDKGYVGEFQTSTISIPESYFTGQRIVNAYDALAKRQGKTWQQLMEEDRLSFSSRATAINNPSFNLRQEIVDEIESTYQEEAEILTTAFNKFKSNPHLNQTQRLAKISENKEKAVEEVRTQVLSQRPYQTIACSISYLEDQGVAEEFWNAYQTIQQQGLRGEAARRMWTYITRTGSVTTQINPETGEESTKVDTICASSYSRQVNKLKQMFESPTITV